MSAVKILGSSIVVACALLALSPAAASAQVDLGGHAGINLDAGNPHLGVDVVITVAHLSPNVSLGVWPSYAHVFIENGHDVELLGCDFPFEFKIDNSIITPFAAPGLGLAFYGDETLKLNLIGGMFLEAGGGVRPFADLAIRLINGTFVDLLFGVVFEL